MAAYEELREAITDYLEQAHKNARVVRSLRHWNCGIYVEAVDLEQGFHLQVRNSQITMCDELPEKPDLIVRGTSEDLADIFWCDANPASAYIQGAITSQGSQDHMMRLDAVSLLIFLELNHE